MWEIDQTDGLPKQQRRFEKRWRVETRNVFVNLGKVFALLSQGIKPLQLVNCGGYIHDERDGVFAVDEKGTGRTNKSLRLYIYPDEKSQILHVLHLGEKDHQVNDLRLVRDYVQSIKLWSDEAPAASSGNERGKSNE